jgi:hypothetical protein
MARKWVGMKGMKGNQLGWKELQSTRKYEEGSYRPKQRNYKADHRHVG